MSVISEKASIGANVKLGRNVVIDDGVVIGENSVIGDLVIIHEGTKIGKSSVIGDNTVLGKKPFRASNSAVTKDVLLEPLNIGEYVTVGAGCILYAGAVIQSNVFIGDLASVREEVSIGEFTIIGRGVSVENKTIIGRYVKVETNAYITAISVIEDYCFIAPEVAFTNDNFLGRTEERKKYFKGPTLKKGARIGANSTILPGVVIAEDTLVAAASVVTRNTLAGKVYIGSPAKALRDVPQEQLLKNQKYYKE
jgi:acetyltransferase-like isoleucine patch superfamily enzyme